MSPGKDHPLGALLEAVARQFELLRENLEDLYDNAFIETNKSWVLPFLGALVLAGIGIAYGCKRRRRRLPSQPEGDVGGERRGDASARGSEHGA